MPVDTVKERLEELRGRLQPLSVSLKIEPKTSEQKELEARGAADSLLGDQLKKLNDDFVEVRDKIEKRTTSRTPLDQVQKAASELERAAQTSQAPGTPRGVQRVVVDLAAGERVYLVVDAATAFASGPYTLSVE